MAQNSEIGNDSVFKTDGTKEVGGRKVEKIKQNPFVKKVGFNRIVLCFVLLLMYAFFCALTQGSFFGIERILSTLNYAYFLGFLSLGVTFVIATGGIDFSIGPVMFCCALISGYCFTSHGMPMPVALILSIVIGLIFGIFNGYLVAYWSVPSFITSMASMNISKGVASVFTKTQSVSWPQEMQDGGWFRKIISIDGIPVGLIIFLAVAIVCAILLNKTKLGRYIYAVGGNETAAQFSGINIKKVKIIVWTISGFLASFAGIVLSARLASGQPSTSIGAETDAIAGCVLGGTSMYGGVGNTGGVLIGIMVIGVISNGLTLMHVDSNWQYVVKGVIILLAVYVDMMRQKKMKSRSE